jgi:RHS repeat-associated protein
MAQTTMFYLPDERGNTAMRLDRNGTILSAHVTDAFGATKTSDYVGSSTDDPFAGFGGSLGYMRESGLDLYRCGLRFYDVANARWLTRDPIGYDGGQNLYGYVSGNPVMGTDPLGLTDYGAAWVEKEKIKWQNASITPFHVFANHFDAGKFDYQVKPGFFRGDRFYVNGRWISIGAFGNYSAGYNAWWGVGISGKALVLGAGHVDEAKCYMTGEQKLRDDGYVGLLDPRIDQNYIKEGVRDAENDTRRKMQESSQLFWSHRREREYLRAYSGH